MPRRKPASPAPMFGDASDLPLFSGTPMRAPAPAPDRAPASATPTSAPELPGMPEAPTFVTVNGYQVRATLARGARLGGRSPHIVHHTGAWQSTAADNASGSRPDVTFGGVITLISVTTSRARAIEAEAGVWLCRPAPTP